MPMRRVERQETLGPTWNDVRELVTMIENHHKVGVRVGTSFTRAGSRGPICYWTCSAWRAVPVEDWVCRCSVVREWPHPDHKTVSGLVYGVLMDLDEKLGREVWRQSKLSELA